jgi:catechol 2,3-dioxygenase-like lactoylglutathione lyase family enzyme
MQLDHIILGVNDLAKSVEFYTRVLGFTNDGVREGTPFTAIRVTPDFSVQLAPYGTKGGEHLAFSMPRAEFERIFARIRQSGIEYGDDFNTVGNMRGPGESGGARGACKSVYVFDPNRHLIEILCYE